MKTLYLFTGLPGSGKSSVPRIFATKEKLPRVSKDDEQMTLFEKFGFNSNDEKKELVKKADHLVFDKLSSLFAEFDSVVLDQWVRSLEFIVRLIDELDVSIVLIYVCASPRVVVARDNGRSRPLCFDAKNVYPVIDGLTEFWPATTVEKNDIAKKEYEAFLKTISGVPIMKLDSDNLSIDEETDLIIDSFKKSGGIQNERLHKRIHRCD